MNGCIAPAYAMKPRRNHGGYRSFANPSESNGHDGNTKLACGYISVQVLQYVLRKFCTSMSFFGQSVNTAAFHFNES